MSVVAIIGIGGVVIVFMAVFSIADGFRAAMRGTGDPQTVIVLRSGSDTEMTSGLGGEEARLIAEAQAAAERLGSVCADFPAERFGALVFQVALLRLKDHLPQDTYQALRQRFEQQPAAFLNTLRLRTHPRAD